jgi:hypothetical protein
MTISLFSQHVSALSGHHQVQLVETFTLHRNSKNRFFIIYIIIYYIYYFYYIYEVIKLVDIYS